MYKYKVGSEGAAGFLTGLGSTEAIIKFCKPIGLLTTTWVMFGRYTTLGAGEKSFWRIDPNGTLAPSPFTAFTGKVHWVASDHSGGFVYVHDSDGATITPIDYTSLGTAGGTPFSTVTVEIKSGFLLSLDDTMAILGAPAGIVKGYSTTTPYA